ncbi:hypothetical protein N1851_018289 [Merluccius polli]|uniref:Uncharacterized protein n=1 Tax=Merluccius polli TaxID=89951 RepID=A0AA47MNH6_MERPO|nr:hypothetical protein N1851_018289 [Merluccius polli]
MAGSGLSTSSSTTPLSAIRNLICNEACRRNDPMFTLSCSYRPIKQLSTGEMMVRERRDISVRAEPQVLLQNLLEGQTYRTPYTHVSWRHPGEELKVHDSPWTEEQVWCSPHIECNHMPDHFPTIPTPAVIHHTHLKSIACDGWGTSHTLFYLYSC